MHFSYNIFSCVNWKYLFLDNSIYFEMSLQYFEEKNIFLSKCLFIFLSQYCMQNILCDVGLNVIEVLNKLCWKVEVKELSRLIWEYEILRGYFWQRSLDKWGNTECVKDLDLVNWSEMIILLSLLHAFKAISIFWGSWKSIKNSFKPKTKPLESC